MIAFFIRRFRWMLLGAAGRQVAKRLTARQIEEATTDLADRLPDRAVSIADALPGDLVRTAGTAQVATRTALRSAQKSRSALQLSKEAVNSPERARQRLTEMGEEWRTAVAHDDRSLRARLIAITRGRDAATDVLLGGRTSWEDQPLPEVPDSVTPGRRTPRVRRSLVRRVQRSYSPRKHSWQ